MIHYTKAWTHLVAANDKANQAWSLADDEPNKADELLFQAVLSMLNAHVHATLAVAEAITRTDDEAK